MGKSKEFKQRPVLICHLVNGTAKLALVVANAAEKKSETVAPELS